MKALREFIDRHRHLPDLHVTRALCSPVAISRGKVVAIDDRLRLDHCPLHAMLGTSDIAGYVEEKIARFGQFTPRRELQRESVGAPFGTSEMFQAALRRGLIEAAVTVCDGAGSVVTARPEVVQGIGARMNGLFYTSPIPAVLDGLRQLGALVWDDARIDQVRAVTTAIDAGFRQIAVTVNVCMGEEFSDLRLLAERLAALGGRLTVAGICSSAAEPDRVAAAMTHADLVWACASPHVRRLAETASLLQITRAIPVFVNTVAGLDLIAGFSDAPGAARLRSLMVAGARDAAGRQQYLLSQGRGADRIRFGAGELALVPAVLPIDSPHCPRPAR